MYTHTHTHTHACVYIQGYRIWYFEECYVKQFPPDTDIFTSNACFSLWKFVAYDSSRVQCAVLNRVEMVNAYRRFEKS